MSQETKHEKELERLKAENERLSLKASIAENRRKIMELKRRYGPDWKKILGLGSSKEVKDLDVPGIRASKDDSGVGF